jgi:hypothetical protein
MAYSVLVTYHLWCMQENIHNIIKNDLKKIGLEDMVMDNEGRDYSLPEKIMIGEFMAPDPGTCRSLVREKVEMVFQRNNLRGRFFVLVSGSMYTWSIDDIAHSEPALMQ